MYHIDEFTTKCVLREVGINCMNSFIELRRARWLEKLAHMKSNRAPRQLLGAWLPYPRRNGEAGRAQTTIRHAYAHAYINNVRI